jgi:hypothetical protein
MVLYNVTVSIDESVNNDWLQWMREEHIPDVMRTGFFKEARLSRVHGEEEGGLTYAITYLSLSQANIETYQKEHAPQLQKEHNEKFAGKFAAFRTFLSVIEEFNL